MENFKTLSLLLLFIDETVYIINIDIRIVKSIRNTAIISDPLLIISIDIL